MPSIRLSDDVKEKLDTLMLKELQKDAKNPKVLIKALSNRYGYTHSEFIDKLIDSYRRK